MHGKLGWVDGGVGVANRIIGVKKGGMKCLCDLWWVRYELIVKANRRLRHAP